ncbi:hypothetical protein F5B20DRAFT_594116 [Whalleya microplaca]|nr:hypothetical protein F5B20DRAFT_594116 [Whalleya microplaca]
MMRFPSPGTSTNGKTAPRTLPPQDPALVKPRLLSCLRADTDKESATGASPRLPGTFPSYCVYRSNGRCSGSGGRGIVVDVVDVVLSSKAIWPLREGRVHGCRLCPLHFACIKAEGGMASRFCLQTQVDVPTLTETDPQLLASLPAFCVYKSKSRYGSWSAFVSPSGESRGGCCCSCNFSSQPSGPSATNHRPRVAGGRQGQASRQG